MDEATRRRDLRAVFHAQAGRQWGPARLVDGPGHRGAIARGHINAIANRARGTKFKIYLPPRGRSAADVASPQPSSAPEGARPVLVVRLGRVRDYAVAALQHTVTACSRRETPRQALLDLRAGARPYPPGSDRRRMPNLGGPELASRLEKLRPGIKVRAHVRLYRQRHLYQWRVGRARPFIESRSVRSSWQKSPRRAGTGYRSRRHSASGVARARQACWAERRLGLSSPLLVNQRLTRSGVAVSGIHPRWARLGGM